MPKNSNKRRVYTTPNDRADPKERLRNRKSVQEQELDDRRALLLAEILDVSTNLSIEESSSPASARQAAQDHAPLLELIEQLRAVESTLDPELPRRSAEAWRDFFDWIDTRSGTLNDNDRTPLSSRIDVCVARRDAKSPLNDEEHSLITKVPIKSDVDLDEFIKNDMIASGMQNVVLVLHLLNEHSKGERSRWWPYLSILPRTLLPILRLNKVKLSQHLMASAHIFEALKMLRAIARQYTYFYKRLQATKLPLKRNFTFMYYAWGVSIVCSRQNEIPLKTRAREQQSPVVHALIPLLDMCNHNRLSNQAIFSDNSSCLTAPSDLEAGQEITINYGCRSSGDFYIHNGFVPDEVAGDTVPLTIALSNDDLLEAKAKLLKILNMPKTIGRFKLISNRHANRHRRDPHLTMFLIVYCLNEQELNLIMSNSNIVGIADYIYDYIQYKMDEPEARETDQQQQQQQRRQNGMGNEMGAEIDKMKLRLANCYKDYLAKRSSVCMALIDRTLKELTTAAERHEAPMEGQQDDKLYAIRLLQREREIYESYVGVKLLLNGR